MTNLQSTNLRDMATAMGIMKKAQAAVTDGVVIGITSKSGGPYTADLASIGSIYKINGKHKLAVDAIVYGDHYSESGATFYKGENRIVLIEFDPKTLKFTGNRTNAGFKSLDKANHLGTIWAFVDAFDKEEAARVAAEQRAARLAARKEAERQAAAKRARLAAQREAERKAHAEYLATQKRLQKSSLNMDLLNKFC